MDHCLTGKRVLITGASIGIGAAAADAFAREGRDLDLAARNEEALMAFAGRLRETYGVRMTVYAVDLRLAADIERLASRTAEIDVLANNAGDIPGGVPGARRRSRLASRLGP